MPEGAVYVGRPTRWGNPFTVGGDACVNYAGRLSHFTVATPAQTVALYRNWLHDPLWIIAPGSGPPTDFTELRGRNLCCWCPIEDGHGMPTWCHADVLLEIANA